MSSSISIPSELVTTQNSSTTMAVVVHKTADLFHQRDAADSQTRPVITIAEAGHPFHSPSLLLTALQHPPGVATSQQGATAGHAVQAVAASKAVAANHAVQTTAADNSP